MKQSFASLVFQHLEKSGIALDSATKRPIERVGREVDSRSGEMTWEKGLDRCHSSAKLYRLSASAMRSLKSDLQRNYYR